MGSDVGSEDGYAISLRELMQPFACLNTRLDSNMDLYRLLCIIGFFIGQLCTFICLLFCCAVCFGI